MKAAADLSLHWANTFFSFLACLYTFVFVFFQPSLIGSCGIPLKSILKSESLYISRDMEVRQSINTKNTSINDSRRSADGFIGALKVHHMNLIATKPVFRVSDIARLKPVSTTTETSQKIENLLVANLDMILSNKRITKALIRLH